MKEGYREAHVNQGCKITWFFLKKSNPPSFFGIIFGFIDFDGVLLGFSGFY